MEAGKRRIRNLCTPSAVNRLLEMCWCVLASSPPPPKDRHPNHFTQDQARKIKGGTMSSSTVTNTGTNLVAFFRDREDAYQAIDELRNQGFRNDEIGLAFQGGPNEAAATSGGGAHTEKSTWQSIKDFFTGGDEDNDTAYSNDNIGEDSYRHFNFSDEQWKYYRSGINQGGAIITVNASADRLSKAREILKEYDADFRTQGFDRSEYAGYENQGTEADQRLQLRGEMLRTYKERIGTGEVRLRKEVVSENRSVDVPVTREEVVIERVSAGET